MMRRTLVLLPAALAIVQASRLALPAARAAAPPALSARAHFECLWWAPGEMEGLRSDSPLPKTTRVKLNRWEYSDPVGVPHPDEVILVLALAAPVGRAMNVAVHTSWRIAGTWRAGEGSPARRVVLEPGVTRPEEFVIPVRRMILDQGARRLAALVMVDGRQALRTELPIIGGD